METENSKTKNDLTFDDLPQVVAHLAGEISSLKNLIEEKRDTSQSQKPDPDELMTIKQASEFLDLTVQTLYNKVSKNEIPFMKRGKRLYFSKEQLIDYLKQGSNEMQSDIDREVNEFLSNKKGDKK